MVALSSLVVLMIFVQIIHSVEEVLTRFDKEWKFIARVNFKFMVSFLILFNLFWLIVLNYTSFPLRQELLSGFMVLMFGRSLVHIIWSLNAKKYTPGLLTAPLEALIYLAFYLHL